MQLFEAKIQIVKYELPIEFRYGVLGKAEGDLFVVARLGGKLDFVQICRNGDIKGVFFLDKPSEFLLGGFFTVYQNNVRFAFRNGADPVKKLVLSCVG